MHKICAHHWLFRQNRVTTVSMQQKTANSNLLALRDYFYFHTEPLIHCFHFTDNNFVYKTMNTLKLV